MLTMLVCATRWFSMHLYTLAYMFMHESCLLVCHPCFNTMKSWTFDTNLHLSLVDTPFVCFPCLFALFASWLAFLPLSHAVLAISILFVCFVTFCFYLCFFLPLLVCYFFVFAFACTHMEWGRMELGHDLLGTSKKGKDASTWSRQATAMHAEPWKPMPKSCFYC